MKELNYYVDKIMDAQDINSELSELSLMERTTIFAFTKMMASGLSDDRYRQVWRVLDKNLIREVIDTKFYDSTEYTSEELKGEVGIYDLKLELLSDYKEYAMSYLSESAYLDRKEEIISTIEYYHANDDGRLSAWSPTIMTYAMIITIEFLKEKNE